MNINKQLVLPETCQGMRCDQALAQQLPEYSRSQIKQWILANQVLLDGKPAQVRTPIKGGETVDMAVTLAAQVDYQAQPMPLSVIYEDEALLVINKPQNCVVHPAPGHREGTLVNALLAYDPKLEQVPRAGLVHRIDKDTTGLLIVARTLSAHNALVKQLKDRELSREYEAIVKGVVISGGVIDAPIGRHPTARVKMAVNEIQGKSAQTHYRVIQRFKHFTHLKLQLETGRTHQIRVHLTHIGFPIVGDQTYGARTALVKGITPELRSVLTDFKRQALHAKSLRLTHPLTGDSLCLTAPLPEDFQKLRDSLAQWD